jgi:hypothetical protein
VLDAILLRHVDQEQSRDEIVAAGSADTVDKVLGLVRVNEWKRHQAAPGPKVSRRGASAATRSPTAIAAENRPAILLRSTARGISACSCFAHDRSQTGPEPAGDTHQC